MVVVVSSPSRRALFDEMMAAGRVMSDALQLYVRHTVGIAPKPYVEGAAVNCQNSLVMQQNYALDRILQDEIEELQRVREDMVQLQQLIDFWQHLLRLRRFGEPPL